MVESNKEQDTHKREEGKRLKEGTAHTITEGIKIGHKIKFEKNPAYIK
jgi:hypothetical protein